MPQKKAILMLGSLLVISGILLNGCAYKGPHGWKMEPGGVTDWIELQPGAVVTGVSLPTDEPDKKYNIVVKKPSAVVSLDMLDRMGK